MNLVLRRIRLSSLKLSYRAVSDTQSEVAATSQSEITTVIERGMSNIVSDISRFIDFSNSRDSSNPCSKDLYLWWRKQACWNI